MKNIKKIFSSSQKGFTLIELLVVIAIVGILAGTVVVAINPQDKINSANDAKVINTVGLIARAGENYATQNLGFYPAGPAATAFTTLVNEGELKTAPTFPSGYTATWTSSPASCTAGTTCTSYILTISALKSKKYTGTTILRYETSTGKLCQVAAAADACP